jgi:hypothetical protein
MEIIESRERLDEKYHNAKQDIINQKITELDSHIHSARSGRSVQFSTFSKNVNN